MESRRKRALIAQIATLEKRLNKGWGMKGDDVDDLFEKLLGEYERIWDELAAEEDGVQSDTIRA